MRKESSTNARNEAELIARCPLAAAIKLVGGRWKLMLVWYIDHGLDRFGKLGEAIPHISEKMLAQQLRELERDGLLVRMTDGTRVRYALTDLARSLVPVLEHLTSWSEQHRVGQLLLGEGRGAA